MRTNAAPSSVTFGRGSTKPNVGPAEPRPQGMRPTKGGHMQRRTTLAIALTALATLASAQTARADHDASVVQTSGGAVRGITRTNYDAWLGLPYAAPPVGQLRLKAPQPAPRWSGVRD